jgi:hypothetical protein
LEFDILNNIDKICSKLDLIDDFYYDRVLFSLTNFSIKYLINNDPNNEKYLIKILNSIYYSTKNSIDNLRLLSGLNSILALIDCYDDEKKEKISKILLRAIITSKTFYEKSITLDIIVRFLHVDNSKIREILSQNIDSFLISFNDKM